MINKKGLFKNKNITLGICGVSTAYKSLYLVERLRKLGATVRVVLNDEAKKYVTPLTFERITGQEVTVKSSGFKSDELVKSSLVDESDITVIAPASFSFIGKLASGLGREPLTDLISSSSSPVVLAPSMNQDLYSSDTVRSYLEQIKNNGFYIVEPKKWEFEVPPDQDVPLTIVINQVVSQLRSVLEEDRLLEDKKILVTSGPTRDVFGQSSFTGETEDNSLGYSLSQQARQMGGEVMLVSGPTDQVPPSGVGVVWTRSVEELDELLTSEFTEYDLILMASSASDWRPELNSNTFGKEKTKKLDLDIPSTPDLARKLGRLKEENQVLVEFRSASSSDDPRSREALVENDIDATFSCQAEDEGLEGDRNLVGGSFLFKSGDEAKVQAQTGSRLAREILKRIGKKYFL